MEQLAQNTFRFNTGRGYSKEGQVVEVEILKTEADREGVDVHEIRFADHTRSIYGKIQVTGEVTMRKIMAEYDTGRYKGLSPFRLGAH